MERSDMNRFENQTAIVTGGTSGLGLAIARRLISEGGFVVVWDTNAKACELVGSELGKGGSCDVVDVTNEAQVQAGVGRAFAKRGKIDVLVNCAGITGKTNIKSHEVAL